MAINLASRYSASLSEYYLRYSKDKASGITTYHPRTEFSPITYTSLRGWMFLNYTLLGIMITLPSLIVYELIQLIL